MRTKVLVVDDDDLVARGLARSLRAKGCDVLEASSADEALRVMGGADVDYVLSDVVMPGMSGVQLLHEARARGFRTPFTLMTGVPRDPGAGQMVDSSVAILTKPPDLTALHAEIVRHMGIERGPLPGPLDALLAASFDAVVALRPVRSAEGALVDLEYVALNDAALRLIGKTSAEVLGRTMKDVLPGPLAQDVVEHAQRVLSGDAQAAGTMLEHVVTSDALSHRSVRYRFARCHDLLVAVGRDAKDEHEDVRDLAARADRYQDIVRIQQEMSTMGLGIGEVYDVAVRRAAELTGADGAFIALADGEDDLVYQVGTGTMAAHVGLRVARSTSLTGRCAALGKVLVTDDAHADPRVNQGAARSTSVRSAVCVPLVTGDETVGVLSVVAAAPCAFGELDVHALQVLSGIMASTIERAQEVEQRRAAQEALLASRDAAEAATHAKSRFLANMSHEIRTPLHGLIGSTEVLLGLSLTGEQRDCAETMRASASSLLVVLNDVLDLSKVEAGKLDIDRGVLPIRSILQQVATLFRDAAAAKSIDIDVEVSDALPAQIVGDDARVRQILANLVGNAVKFTGRGRVRMGATGVVSDAREMVRFFVSDEGPGLSEEARARLFTPFQQGDTSSTRIHGGTGLGLAIARSLVDLMDGQIGVDDNEGAGATFWFTLPMTAVAAQAPVPAAPPCEVRAGLRVLVAEDNRTNQKIVKRMLEQLGCVVDIVGDGLAAVEAAAAKDYDVVLMDCQMPELDGYDATRAIRHNQGAARRTPIVALTASAMREDKARCLEAGMDAHVAKPFSRDDLAAALSRSVPVGVAAPA